MIETAAGARRIALGARLAYSALKRYYQTR